LVYAFLASLNNNNAKNIDKKETIIIAPITFDLKALLVFGLG
jgi:hypothetical protein